MSPSEKSSSKASPDRRDDHLELVKSVILVILAFWIYHPVFHGGWLWDDDVTVLRSDLMHRWSGILDVWGHYDNLGDYFPLKSTVMNLEWHLWHTHTLGYHLTNIALHTTSAFLLWRLLEKLGLRLPWFGALLFVVHPLMVESVAWINELKNALSLPLLLLAALNYVEGEKRPGSAPYWKALLWFAAAMLCKSSVVMFPFVLLLHAWWLRQKITLADLKASAPFFLVSLILGSVTMHSQGTHGLGSGFDPMAGGLPARLLNAGLITAFYLEKFFFPIHLANIYPQWTVEPQRAVFWLPWVLLPALLLWFWLRRGTWGRHALFGLGFFLFMLAPVVGFLRMNYLEIAWVADHLVYAPMVGLIGLVTAAAGVVDARLNLPARRIYWGALGGALLLLSLASHQYARTFQSQAQLWAATLRVNPSAYLAYTNMGWTKLDQHRPAEAVELFRKALTLRPRFAALYGSLAYSYALANDPVKAEAEYREALTLWPASAELHDGYGSFLLDQGESSEATDEFHAALKTDPDDALALASLGGISLGNGDDQLALDELTRAVRLAPHLEVARRDLGNALQKLGRPQEAIVQYKLALQLDPGDKDAIAKLAELEAPAP